MYLTIHGPVGALIGATTGEPISAFALSFLSHGILDAIPHGDEKCSLKYKPLWMMIIIAAIDGLIMLAALAVLLRPWETFPGSAMLAGIIGSVLPDVLQGLHDIFTRNWFFARFRRLHDHVHRFFIPYELPPGLGLCVQLVVFGGAVIALQFVQ